jgi:hypothetical protein
MAEQYFDSLSSGSSDGGPISLEPRSIEPERRNFAHVGNLALGAASETSVLAPAEREQLARDFADIERAIAALQRAEPALESWSKSAMPADSRPRPLWLLIGVLWLSTALITAGATAIIASLAR